MSVTVIHSAPKVNTKANDVVQPSKRETEVSDADDAFSESLNDEVKAIQNEPETTTKTNEMEKEELHSEVEGQEISALVPEVLPLPLPEIKPQDIDLDETITALNDIVAQLGEEETNILMDDENIDLLNKFSPLQHAHAQIDKQIDKKPENTGLSTAKSALLNAADKQRAEVPPVLNAADKQSNAEQAKLLTDKAEVTPSVLFKPEKLESDKKPALNLSALSASVKQELVSSDLPVDKVVTKLSDLPQLQGGDTLANKNIIADLAGLNRQVESMQTSKQEVPALTKPLNHPEWKQEFNERIIWMQNKGISSAEVRINPNNLGPISISIKMDAEQQANIAINVQNGAVRDAVESALPRLREMLNAQQVALADVNVSQQQQQGQNNARQAMEDAQQESNKANAGKLDQLGDSEIETDNLADEINMGRAVASKGLLSLYA